MTEEEKEYRVIWEIDIVASSPIEAAKQALEIQRNPESLATVFAIFDEDGDFHRVDLLEVTASELDTISDWLNMEHP